jgi:hypothetical protein
VSSLTFLMSYVLDFSISEKMMVCGKYHQFDNCQIILLSNNIAILKLSVKSGKDGTRTPNLLT